VKLKGVHRASEVRTVDSMDLFDVQTYCQPFLSFNAGFHVQHVSEITYMP
jgi:hypothetical protein